MVDFNNEKTIGTPAVDVERISILQRRYDLFEAFEDYKKKNFQGAGYSLAIVRARLISFFLEIQAILKRRLSEENYNRIKTVCFDCKEEEKIIETIYLINDELDIMRLTRIDVQKVYDSSDVEEENKAKGY